MTLFTALMLAMTPVHAAPCRTRTWTGESASLRKIKAGLDRMSRAEVVQLAWGEMLKADPRGSVALPALQYLNGTEPNPSLRGYYKTMAVAMTAGRSPGEALARWPTRAPAARSPFTLPQLCAMYRRAGGG